MAIDPIFIALGAVPEFAALGGEASLSVADRETLEEVRRAPRVVYPAVRRLKNAALRSSFERFIEAEWRPETEAGLRPLPSEVAYYGAVGRKLA